MIYPDLLKEIKREGYCTLIDSASIKVQLKRLDTIPDGALIGNNLHEAKAVRALVSLKLAVTLFLENGAAWEQAEYVISLLTRYGDMYDKAIHAMNPAAPDVLDKILELRKAIEGLAMRNAEIRRDFDRLMKDGDYIGTVRDFIHLKNKYSTFGSVDDMQGLFFDFGDTPFQLLSAKKAISDLRRKKIREAQDAMFRNYLFPEKVLRDTIAEYDSLKLLPPLSIAQGIADAPVLFVSTPILEEFDIALNANLHQGGIERITQLNLLYLPKQFPNDDAKEYLSKMFLWLMREKAPNVIAINGLEYAQEGLRKALYFAINEFLIFVSHTIRVVIMDDSGDMSAFMDYTAMKKAFGFVAADNKYLRLPFFEDVAEINDAFTPDQLETVRKRCVFMGYRGLALLSADKSELGLAIDAAKVISDQNKGKALPFLEKLLDDSKFVPSDWRYEPEVTLKKEDDSGYDYDKIRDVSDERVKAILDNGALSIFQKCGELVKYVFLADEDISVWATTIPEEDRRQRVRKATHLVAFAMRLFYDDPTVVFETLDGANGQCCDGGQTIKFDLSTLEKAPLLMRTLLHELYHSLQHTVTDCNTFLGWYKREFHIESERIESWRTNFYGRNYRDSGVNYFIQVVEVDARSYACYCLGDQIYEGYHDSYRKRRR